MNDSSMKDIHSKIVFVCWLISNTVAEKNRMRIMVEKAELDLLDGITSYVNN